MISAVYGILHLSSGRWYVGWSHNVVARWYSHRSLARRGDARSLYEGLRRGDDFLWIVLQPCEASEALSIEERWIAKLGAYYGGFNLVPTSAISPSKFDEVRRKIGAASKANFTGSGNPFFGRRHSAETIALIKMSARARPEWHKRAGVKNRGRRRTSEQLERLRQSHRGVNGGQNNPMYGRRHTAETRAAISAANRRRWAINKKRPDPPLGEPGEIRR